MQTDVPEASEMGQSIFIPRAVVILKYCVPILYGVGKPTPLWCKLVREAKQHTFGVSQSGRRLARSGRSENRGWIG